MANQRYTTEEIIHKLRDKEVVGGEFWTHRAGGIRGTREIKTQLRRAPQAPALPFITGPGRGRLSRPGGTVLQGDNSK